MIERSIVGAGVQIKERSWVERGCLIADKVTIGPEARLEPFQKLLRKCQDDEEDDEDEDEDIDEIEHPDNQRLMRIGMPYFLVVQAANMLTICDGQAILFLTSNCRIQAQSRHLKQSPNPSQTLMTTIDSEAQVWHLPRRLFL